MVLGQRIKNLRIEKRMTQKELGHLVNVSSQVISNWERGYTSTIDSENLSKLAEVLNTSTEYLLGRTENPSPTFDILYKDNNLLLDIIEQLNGFSTDSTNLEIFKQLPLEEKINILRSLFDSIDIVNGNIVLKINKDIYSVDDFNITENQPSTIEDDWPELVPVLRRAGKKPTPEERKRIANVIRAFMDEDD